MILDKCEKIFSLIKKYPDIIQNDCFQEFCESQGLVNLTEFKKSRLKMSLIAYKEGIDPTQSFKEQIFSKFFKIILVESLNFISAVNKLKSNKRKIFPYEKMYFRLVVLYRIANYFEKFLNEYYLPDWYLSKQYGFLAEILDFHYQVSEKCYYLIRHRLSQKQKKSILKDLKKFNIRRVARIYRYSRKIISNIEKGRR